MPMDAQLAEIYGTPGAPVDQDDVEKTASAELLVKIAEENGIDINTLSDDQIMELAGAVQGGGAEPEGQVKVAEATDGNLYVFDENDNALEMIEGQVKVASAEDGSLWVVDDENNAICPFEGTVEDEQPTEFQEKVGEADFLGKVIAHSCEAERREIQKEAKAREALGKLWGRLKGVKAEQTGFTPSKSTGFQRVKELLTGARKKGLEAYEKGPKPAGAYHPGAQSSRAAERAAEAKKVLLSRIGAGAAGTAALGGTAAGVSAAMGDKGKKKAASALEAIDERAYEMLKEAGWVNPDGTIIPPDGQPMGQEKTAADEIEVGALQRLQELGYAVEWNQ